jgi:hypothetical protein
MANRHKLNKQRLMKTKEEVQQLAEQDFNDRQECGHYELADLKSIDYYYDGFTNGYTHCQQDMADESIRFADWINKNDYEKIHGDRWCKKFMSYTHSTVELFEIFIQSLNKQD